MINYQTFIFKSYNFDRSTKTLTLEYGYDDELSFTETYTFDFELADYDEAVMDKACQLLFFMAGVSYYKSYLAPSISVQAGVISNSLAAFLSKTYQRGLGEFFYVNKLDPLFEILFPVNTNDQPAILKSNGTGCLVGLGGGKDSLVSVELLRNTQNISTWSLGHKAQLMPLVDRINLEHLC